MELVQIEKYEIEVPVFFGSVTTQCECQLIGSNLTNCACI